MSSLSQESRHDLDKFTKFFIYKCSQVIVQSRLGQKTSLKSKPYPSRTDWFNLAIEDYPDVRHETKKALGNQYPLLGKDVCVEISLQTSEGASMVLETWFITMDTSLCDTNVKVSPGVYNRMGTALKSLMCVSRVTPAYKLSRRQSQEDYIICYRFYVGEPQFFLLGDGYHLNKVGAVPTPIGTININLAYRTKLLITPQKTSKDIGFEVKDDHFKKDNSPRRPTTPKPCSRGIEQRRDSMGEEMGPGSFDTQDSCTTTFINSPPAPSYLSPEISSSSLPRTLSQPIKMGENPFPASIKSEDLQQTVSAPAKQDSFTNYHKVGAFAQPFSKEIKGDVEFLNLLTHQHPKSAPNLNRLALTDNLEHSESEPVSLENNPIGVLMDASNSKDSNTCSSSSISAPDDFVLVELKTPFASAPESNVDGSKFIRESAPMLESFSQDQNAAETLDMISSQLIHFESNMPDFDAFVNSLTESLESLDFP